MRLYLPICILNIPDNALKDFRKMEHMYRTVYILREGYIIVVTVSPTKNVNAHLNHQVT